MFENCRRSVVLSLRLAGIFWMMAFTALAAAQTARLAGAEPIANGCGSGWNNPIVPDRIVPLACEFKASCDQHDRCYGNCQMPSSRDKPQCEYLRCKAGGDLAGKPICNGPKFRELGKEAAKRRNLCDAQFAQNLGDANPNRPQCRFFAWLYPSAVKVLGASAFIGIDGVVDSGLTEADRQAYADAINAMLTKWPPERLQAFEEDVKAGKIKIDLNKRIAFDATRGLFNP